MRKLINPTGISEMIINGIEPERTGMMVRALVDSPRIYALKKQNDYYEDVAGELFDQMISESVRLSLFPNGMKATMVLHLAANDLREFSKTLDTVDRDNFQKINSVADFVDAISPHENEPYFVNQKVSTQIKGWKVSGLIPLFNKETGTLYDFKYCSSQTYKDRWLKPLREKELNALSWVMEQNDLEIKEIRVVYLIGNWRAYNPEMTPAGYPPSKFFEETVEMMEPNKLTNFMLTQMMNHISAEMKLPLCSAQELWSTGTLYKVYKPNKKSPERIETNEKIIDDYIAKNDPKNRFRLRKEITVGKAARCVGCVVNTCCGQYGESLRKETLKKEKL